MAVEPNSVAALFLPTHHRAPHARRVRPLQHHERRGPARSTTPSWAAPGGCAAFCG